MLNNRPYNAKQVTQNVRFQSHNKGMGDIMEYQPDSPVLQIVGGKSFGNSGGLYQGVTRSGQYRGMKGLGDDGSSVTLPNIGFPASYDSTSGVYNTPASTSANESIQDSLVSAGLDPNTSATIANIVTNPIVWVGVVGVFIMFSQMGNRRR
jgi:hypothetical protein